MRTKKSVQFELLLSTAFNSQACFDYIEQKMFVNFLVPFTIFVFPKTSRFSTNPQTPQKAQNLRLKRSRPITWRLEQTGCLQVSQQRRRVPFDDLHGFVSCSSLFSGAIRRTRNELR